MKNIFRIISKNLKLLVRAKSSALIIILAPLLIILLMGIAFDNANTYGLNIGVYSSDFNQNIESFLTKLSQKEFKIVRYDNQEKCVSDIKLGTTHTCVIFPPDLDFASNQQQQVTFYVDYSKINLVWMIMDTLSSGITERSREISKDLTNILVSRLENTKTELNDKKPILLETKNENNNVLVKAQEIDSKLTTISFNVSSLGISTTQATLSATKDDLETKIDGAQDAIKTARSIISSSSASDGDKDDALEQISEALSDLDVAKEKINDNESNSSLAKVSALINDIENKVMETKTQIASATTSSKQKIGEAQTSLDQSLNNLATIETMMDSLISEIQAIKVTDPEAIANPVTTEIKPVAAEKTYLNYLFPGLIILVIMFISILLGTTLVMMEKHSPALFRNFITPTRNITFIVSTYLTNIFLVLTQLVIILAIAMYFFSAQILPSLPMVILVLFIAATLFSFVGMAVGYLFMSEETGTLAAISFGSLCLFMSSTIIPLESMPATVRQIAYYNPFVIAERLLRSVILFQPKIKLLANDIFLLLGYSLVLFLFIWGSQHLASKHIFQKFRYRHRKKKGRITFTSAKTEIKQPLPKKETATAKPEPKPVPPPESETKKTKDVPKSVIAEEKPVKKPFSYSKSKNRLDAELQRIDEELSKLQ